MDSTVSICYPGLVDTRHPTTRPVAQTERLAIVVADVIGKLSPSGLVRSLLVLDADELIRLGNAVREQAKNVPVSAAPSVLGPARHPAGA